MPPFDQALGKRPLSAVETHAAHTDKRQKTGGSQCPTEEPHECPSAGSGKLKWYAIWGGPNPGVHHNSWDKAQKWAEGCGQVRQKSFVDPKEALSFYNKMKQQYPMLAARPTAQGAWSDPQKRPQPAPHSRIEPVTAPPLSKQHVPDIVPIRESPLCKEQADLVAIILEGQNVFYTGSAGVGKSTVLKVFRRRFKDLGKKVQVVAPTGRAALDVNGQTTWTYAGWTPGHHKKPLKALREDAWQKQVKRRLRRTDVLVIDEISMVENLHLERLNAIMKDVRQDNRAFGGVQVIVTGDFCQLPPVKPFQHCIDCGTELMTIRKGTAYKCSDCSRIYDEEDKWAFRSKAWEECDFEHVHLSTIHRQSDPTFTKMLRKVRYGEHLASEDIDVLLNHQSNTDGAVKLFPRRQDVKRVNDMEFEKLTTPARVYDSIDDFDWWPGHWNLQYKGERADDGTIKALKDHRYEPQLQLKKGMLVVLLANLNVQAGLVNGSQGSIIGFTEAVAEQVEENDSSSRSPQPETSSIETDSPDDALTDERIDQLDLDLLGDYAEYRQELIKKFMKKCERREWPIVKFMNGLEVPIMPDCTVNELGDDQPYSLLSRTQIPLMAAWAMTVHKSQGMTLNRVIVDLSRSFEEGQAYVALSRARSLDGLKVVSFPESAQIGCNEEVRDFLEENGLM